MSGTRPKAVAAMSGGVDSSTAAALMKERGFDVLGVTLQLWSCDLDPGGPAPPGRACCGEADIPDAQAVADALGIEHHVLDGRAEFVQRVVHPARDVQAAGGTPNPCVLCNQHLKFGLLLDWARERGASLLVTGHYARIDRTGEPALLQGVDRTKDQSYFLFTLAGSGRLSQIDFPLGDLTKTRVRQRAAAMGLPVAGKDESQDLCFPVASRESDAPGDLVDGQGAVLGRHAGLSRYTVGQRKGLGIPGTQRMYVVELRPEANQVVVGPEEALMRGDVRVVGIVWSGGPPDGPVDVQARIRYRQDPAPAHVTADGDALVVTFDEPQKAVTPGQALVCYDGERVLGGGWIDYSMTGSQPQGGTRK
jgi:tRNA-specific 2-thiouridylase